MEPVQLKGITWDHSRGFTSIVGISQRFHELNPHIEITWQKRSLQAFADEPIQQLARQFDLLIIDHPWAGFAAKSQAILPLDEYLSSAFLIDQEEHSVGKSHESYRYDGHQWAIALDAATPVAASRPDLLMKNNEALPQTWADLLRLAKRGWLAIPGIPQDVLMSFYMLCSTQGEDVCTSTDEVVSKEIGMVALELLRDLGKHIPNVCFDMNPIAVYEAMTSSDQFLYSPFAYGYSNYARAGYANKRLKFHDLVSLDQVPLVSTLGGTGLAISASTPSPIVAAAFTAFACSPNTQRRLYFDSGGQPAHRSAWLDPYTNAQTADYFADTLPALNRAYLRPRYHGHMYFQDHAGSPIRAFMMHGGNATSLLGHLNELYQYSLKEAK